MPESLAYLWKWFQVLHGARRYGMAGPERISMADIDAANRLLGWNLRPLEAEGLTIMDLVTLYPDAGEEKE